MKSELEFVILGCGSSGGVPRLGGADGGGNWGACDPHNPKNRRTRCSALVRQKGADGVTHVLIDTSPDMREQLLAARVTHLDGVLITHVHADQLHGIDDLRAFFLSQKKRIDLYSDSDGLAGVRAKFDYCFATPPGSDYPPIATAHEISESLRAFDITGAGGSVSILPFAQNHGRITSLGFRMGPIAYSSDVDGLDEAAFAVLDGIDTWVVDALRYTPHPSHAHVARTLEWIARVRPRHAVLTNLHVDLDYETLKRELPKGVEPAYDGMVLSVAL
jgi:phosphoribosyl 1,2-cyclic phosphate phosphodiesterase